MSLQTAMTCTIGRSDPFTDLALTFERAIGGFVHDNLSLLERLAQQKPQKPISKVRIYKIPEPKKRVIQRSYYTGLSSYDIAYFLDVSPWCVQKIFKEIGPTRSTEVIARFGKIDLTYRLASQVYEMVDSGAPINNIAKSLHTSLEIVNYLLEQRAGIEPRLIEKLSILYGVSITKPYKMEFPS